MYPLYFKDSHEKEEKRMPENKSDVLLEMKDITKMFPGVVALSHVDLTIKRGEIHLLLGENGAGKSTMIKTIIGINQPEGGEIWWEGQKVEHQTIANAYEQGIAVVYQELSNIPILSVVENMYLGNEIKKGMFIDWAQERKSARAALDYVGLTDIELDAPMSKYGMGQRQLVEIARAVDRKAKLIIMDEPTSSLSRREIDDLLKLMLKLKSEGVAILFITHKLDEGKAVGDRVTVLRDGQNVGEPQMVADVTEDDIIKLMVGREMSAKFPPRNHIIGEEVLRCENLSGGGFADVSFNLRKGEVLGMFGLVGAGRTETVRALFGADPLVEGKVFIDGKEVKIKNTRQAIDHGIVLATENRKEEGLVLIHDVIENATIPTMNNYKSGLLLSNAKRKEVSEEMGKKTNLRPLQTWKRAMDFSGGNQQKIVVMKWLLADAKVYIFDEPTKGVDVGAKMEIYTIMDQLLKEGASIIMVSSEMEEILGMSDRVMTMYEGVKTGEVPNDGTYTSEDILTLATGGTLK